MPLPFEVFPLDPEAIRKQIPTRAAIPHHQPFSEDEVLRGWGCFKCWRAGAEVGRGAGVAAGVCLARADAAGGVLRAWRAVAAPVTQATHCTL